MIPFRRAVPLLVAAMVVAAAAHADPPPPAAPGPWKFKTVLSLNLSQSSFSSNWHGGDTGNMSWVANADGAAERQFSRHFNLLNTLQLAYGQTSRQEPDAGGQLKWDTPDKTSDMIAFESTGRWTLQSFADPYLALRLDSQFLDQSDPVGDILFNPVKLKESAGLARVLLKTDSAQVVTRLGFGFRQTFGFSFSDPLTKKKDQFISNDGGVEWQTNAAGRVLDDKVVVIARLLVFQPVFYSEADHLKQFDGLGAAANPSYQAVADFWKATDVDLQATFSTAITKHLNVNLFAQFLYDKFDSAANVEGTLDQTIANGYLPGNDIEHNVRKAGQFKETLSLGLTYQLF
jgi:hypothetical protein